MEKPFTIYLDIDGVLVSYLNLKDRDPDGKPKFSTKSVETLNSIISLFDAHICIVSTWGRPYWNNPENSNEFKNLLTNRGIIVNGLTFGDPDRRAEYIIKRKLEGITNFLIIDDESYEYYDKMSEIGYNRILNTNSWRGLDEHDFIKINRNYNRLINKI